jgi:PAS domain-containing protein
MRQWELFGITDTVPTPPPPRKRFQGAETIAAVAEGRPVFFWTTDSALRLRTVTGAATEILGMPFSRCEGRNLLDLFGMEGPNLEILEAHVAALNGETATFALRGERATVRCEVAPTHDALDRVTGTFCLAMKVENVDVRDAETRPLEVAAAVA